MKQLYYCPVCGGRMEAEEVDSGELDGTALHVGDHCTFCGMGRMTNEG